MTSEAFNTWLIRNKACGDAISWAATKGFDNYACWHDCERGHWLLWSAEKAGIDRHLLISAAVECAATALYYTTDQRVHDCIDTVRRWCKGETVDLEAADAAAWAAARAAARAAAARAARVAAAAAEAAAGAAAAAARVAEAAAAAGAAAAAAAAAEAAAGAAAEAAAGAEAEAAANKEHADIVRSIIPFEAVVAAIKGGHRK